MAHFYIYETKLFSIKFTPSNVLLDYEHIIVSIQQAEVIINKTEKEMEIDKRNGRIYLNLSQEESGRFKKGNAKLQVNIYYNYHERDVSKQCIIEVRDNIYKKVIQND